MAIDLFSFNYQLLSNCIPIARFALNRIRRRLVPENIKQEQENLFIGCDEKLAITFSLVTFVSFRVP